MQGIVCAISLCGILCLMFFTAKSSEKVIFKELGCFVDEAERDFPFKSDYGGSLTRELCQRRCLNEGFKYSAVQVSTRKSRFFTKLKKKLLT